jgi:hypothetical protein
MNSTISQNRPNFFAYLCGLTIGFVSSFSGNHRHHVRRSTPAMSGRSTSLDAGREQRRHLSRLSIEYENKVRPALASRRLALHTANAEH